jgi:nucleotide-binding universal stress UspA family protein
MPSKTSTGKKTSSMRRTIQRIVHPTDFSKTADRAFRQAVELARQNRAELVLVHVLIRALPPPSLWRGVYDRIDAQERRVAENRLSALLARARKAKVRARTLVLSGVTYDQIVRVAESMRADLIVMGSHGRTGFSKLLLGSVAERVSGLAPCPVLIVGSRTGRKR